MIVVHVYHWVLVSVVHSTCEWDDTTHRLEVFMPVRGRVFNRNMGNPST